MEFDQARIAICERTWFDNLDLALHVIRAHFKSITLAALAGILPLALANHWLLERVYPNDLYDDLNRGSIWLLVLLVTIEAPLATAPLTLYLGQSLFVEKPRAGQIASDFLSCLPQLILLQVVVRSIFIVLVVTWIFPYAVWPFLNEVILLERNPLFGRKGQVSTLKRNTVLHDGNSGDYMIRALATLFLAPLLASALWVTQWMVLDGLFGIDLDHRRMVIATQAVFWVVEVYFTVARFLSYLDQRIRREGWEVELFLRAERERLTRRIA